MKTAIYARVNTNNGQDPEIQLRELREYCERRGCEVAGEYVDAGISGAEDSWASFAEIPEMEKPSCSSEAFFGTARRCWDKLGARVPRL